LLQVSQSCETVQYGHKSHWAGTKNDRAGKGQQQFTRTDRTVAHRPVPGQSPWLQVQPLLRNRQISKHSLLGNDSINRFLWQRIWMQWQRYCWTITIETVFSMWFTLKCYK
jgi:hypothetical protein